MQPVYGCIVIVGKSFANGGRGKSVFILAHVGANDGLLILMPYGTQSPVMGRMGKELGALIRLLNILRHALKRSETVLLRGDEGLEEYMLRWAEGRRELGKWEMQINGKCDFTMVMLSIQ